MTGRSIGTNLTDDPAVDGFFGGAGEIPDLDGRIELLVVLARLELCNVSELPADIIDMRDGGSGVSSFTTGAVCARTDDDGGDGGAAGVRGVSISGNLLFAVMKPAAVVGFMGLVRHRTRDFITLCL